MRAVPIMPEPWQIYAGDDEALQVTLRDDNCDRISLDGFTITAAWRCSSCSDPEVQLRVDDSHAADGVITVFISGDQSSVDGGVIRDGVFDIQTVKDGVTRTILRGNVAWMGDVER